MDHPQASQILIADGVTGAGSYGAWVDFPAEPAIGRKGVPPAEEPRRTRYGGSPPE